MSDYLELVLDGTEVQARMKKRPRISPGPLGR